jgi:small subunit ribosomal protein S20
MANTAAAKKSIRVIERKTEINKSHRTKVRTFFRRVHDAIAKGVLADARKSFVEFESVLMKAVKHGIYKKNTASRKLTRLAKHIKNMKSQ